MGHRFPSTYESLSSILRSENNSKYWEILPTTSGLTPLRMLTPILVTSPSAQARNPGPYKKQLCFPGSTYPVNHSSCDPSWLLSAVPEVSVPPLLTELLIELPSHFPLAWLTVWDFPRTFSVQHPFFPIPPPLCFLPFFLFFCPNRLMEPMPCTRQASIPLWAISYTPDPLLTFFLFSETESHFVTQTTSTSWVLWLCLAP